MKTKSIVPQLLALGLVSVANTLSAQDAGTHPDRPQIFLERTYFAPLNPIDKDLVFQAEVAAHYFLFDQFTWGWLHGGGWKFAMPVSFMPVVRMSTSTSRPVLTPSYKIRPIWLQAIHSSGQLGAGEKKFSFLGLAGGAVHYSNGQDHCTYKGYARDTIKPFRCRINEPVQAAKFESNIRDGDFSTTYFAARADYRRGTIEDSTNRMKAQWTLFGEVQIDPLNMQPGGLDRELALRYGQHQVNVGVEYEHSAKWPSPGHWRASVSAIVRPPHDTGLMWRTLDIEASRVFDNAQGLGVFARAHFGGDFYNIQFQENGSPLVTLGIVWELSRITQFNRVARLKAK